MRFTPQQRRDQLGLFNVVEASRELGVCKQRLYYLIRAGQVPSPTVAIGSRMYYRDLDELKKLIKEQE